MNRSLPDETIVFVDAIHPEYRGRSTHGWFIRSEKPAIRSATGFRRLNLHAALDLGKMKVTMAGAKEPPPARSFGCSKNRSGTIHAAG